MTRSGKMAGVLALLAALLIGSPASAQNSDRYRDLRKEVDELRRELDYLKQRWPVILNGDPYYNVNCSIDPVFFQPAFPPRRRQPWLQFKEGTAARSTPTTREQTLLGSLDPSSCSRNRAQL